MDRELQTALETLVCGKVILYPTDTIWGIGCDATDSAAVSRIYGIKKRSDSKSMLVLINGFPMLEHYLDQVPPQVTQILDSAEKPTTLIYPSARNLATNLLAKDGSVGIRITSDPFCNQLITLLGKPLVSTSANISGNPSPQVFRDVDPKIIKEVDYVVKWRLEETASAKASAIIKLESDGGISILRS